VSYLLEKTDFHISVDSIVSHLSLSAGPKKGMVIFGSSDSKLATHEHNYNVSSNRPCSPCIDSTNNPNCCLIQNPKLFPTIDRVTRILRENFLLSPPKKSGWLIEDEANKKNISKVL
jgi:ADP-heptose:LPS heptosyltransferase